MKRPARKYPLTVLRFERIIAWKREKKIPPRLEIHWITGGESQVWLLAAIHFKVESFYQTVCLAFGLGHLRFRSCNQCNLIPVISVKIDTPWLRCEAA